MPTSKTPLMSLLRRACQLAVAANQPHSAPADELVEQFYDHQSRRAFLRSSGQLALLAGGLSTLSACQPTDLTPVSTTRGARTGPSVAIVGGGIAGLHAAHILTKYGLTNFTIYEGSTLTGGRIRTAKNLLATDLTTELGGEFIDSGHEDMLNLAQEFGLSLIDTQAASERALIKDAYFFNGQLYSLAQIVAAFQPFLARLIAYSTQLPDTIDYTVTSGTAYQLDRFSINQFLDLLGTTGVIRSLLTVAYETEFGLSCNVQTSLNLLTLLPADPTRSTFDIYGDSDERYKIAGGNQQITDRLTQLYQSNISTGAVLQSLSLSGTKYTLSFSGRASVQADYVLLALPFTKLRQVSTNIALPARKLQAINQLGYGTNAKLLLGLSSRVWRSRGYTGYVFSDNGLQSGWDNSQLQAGTAGGFTVFTGGATGVQLGTGTPAQQAQTYLPKLNQIFPGASAQYNGKAERFHWPSYPFALGSYACYTVGQKTTFGGAEGEPVGKLFFAGEHCSADFQGYMNGGAETGRVAATQLLQAAGIPV